MSNVLEPLVENGKVVNDLLQRLERNQEKLYQMQDDATSSQMIRALRGLVVTGLGAGALYRGLQFFKQKTPLGFKPPEPVAPVLETELPLAGDYSKRRKKTADDAVPVPAKPGPITPPPAAAPSNNVLWDLWQAATSPITGYDSRNITHWMNRPGAPLFGAAAIAGGLYGGYKLSDWLADALRKKDIQAERDKAKEDFYSAMVQGGQPKMAQGNQTLPDYVQRYLNWYLLAGGLAAAAVGHGTYKDYVKQREMEVLRQAQKERELTEQLLHPSPISISPSLPEEPEPEAPVATVRMPRQPRSRKVTSLRSTKTAQTPGEVGLLSKLMGKGVAAAGWGADKTSDLMKALASRWYIPVTMAAAAPFVAGKLVGTTIGKLAPGPSELDEDDLQDLELTEEYRRQANRLRNKKLTYRPSMISTS